MKQPRYFKHFKGNYYKLLHIANDSETTERMVVYQALYGEGKIWVRPEKMFFEEIERDGKKIRRFEEVDEIDVLLEPLYTIYGAKYPSPSFVNWRVQNIGDIPLTDEEYSTLRKGYVPDSNMKFTIHAYRQNIYIIRSGCWVAKFIWRKHADGVYHLEESYSGRGDDICGLLGDVMTCGYFESDVVRNAWINANK